MLDAAVLRNCFSYYFHTQLMGILFFYPRYFKYISLNEQSAKCI